MSTCGRKSASDGFVTDAGGEGGMDAAPMDADSTVGLGGPCVDDGQCDDEIPCTEDACDEELGRCRHDVKHAVCEDDTYCDGQELCDLNLGCIEGEPIACSDEGPCTVDRCVEETRSCEHFPRDADSDGDPVWNCGEGGDCDDTDPRVSSNAPEVCDNGTDDDCDREVDEADCERPEYDTCEDALEIEADTNTLLVLGAATSDYEASCGKALDSTRDVVFHVPAADEPRDIEVVAIANGAALSLAAFDECGDPSEETKCATSLEAPDGLQVARMRVRAQTREQWFVLFSDQDETVNLKVTTSAPLPPPNNETCGTALPLESGQLERVEVFSAAKDAESRCEYTSGELFYSLTLDQTSDVRVAAAAQDAYGDPVVSLRDATCAEVSSELTCREPNSAELYARALPAGEYFVMAAGDGPALLSLHADVLEPSEAPESETCGDAPLLRKNQRFELDLAAHTDDIAVGCLAGAVDAALQLTIEEDSDLLLLQRASTASASAVSLSGATCQEGDFIACQAGDENARLLLSNVPGGAYRVIAEARDGAPIEVTALSRAASVPRLVPFADSCQDAMLIDEAGGIFFGNTASATAVYSAQCDTSLAPRFGAPDQLLKLSLEERSRVFLDTTGSSYQVLLNVRRGPSCPGSEMLLGCSRGAARDPSHLDLTLDPGDYFIQVDGFDEASGPWTLNVFVLPSP